MSDVELPDPEDLEEMKSNSFTRRVALITAVYAVVLSITSLGGGNATKDMMLAQQQAADQWAFFQAKSIRGHHTRLQMLRLEADLADRAPTMQEETRKKAESLLTELKDESERYVKEKKEIENKARELEHERDINRSKDPYFDYAAVLLQIAIVMSSIAILSSSRRMFGFSAVLASLGTLLMFNGFTLAVTLPFLGGH